MKDDESNKEKRAGMQTETSLDSLADVKVKPVNATEANSKGVGHRVRDSIQSMPS